MFGAASIISSRRASSSARREAMSSLREIWLVCWLSTSKVKPGTPRAPYEKSFAVPAAM